jgi:hypothetical protein
MEELRMTVPSSFKTATVVALLMHEEALDTATRKPVAP